MSEVDLSGRWSGFYNYPGGGGEGCRFEAELRDWSGRLAGETSEPGSNLSLTGTVRATLVGCRDGAAIAFTKIYDDLRLRPYSIRYEGALASCGDEIEGRWTISATWSGTFLMVRHRRAAETAEAESRATVKG